MKEMHTISLLEVITSLLLAGAIHLAHAAESGFRSSNHPDFFAK
jgi:hypothetical protein